MKGFLQTAAGSPLLILAVGKLGVEDRVGEAGWASFVGVVAVVVDVGTALLEVVGEAIAKSVVGMAAEAEVELACGDLVVGFDFEGMGLDEQDLESGNRTVDEIGRCGKMGSVNVRVSERGYRSGGVGLGGSLSYLNHCIVSCVRDLSSGFEICPDVLGPSLLSSFASFARRILETSRSIPHRL